MSPSSVPRFTPEGLGSVSGAPNLPVGFSDTFTSRYVDAGELRSYVGCLAMSTSGTTLNLLGGDRE